MVGVIIPAWNEAPRIAKTVAAAFTIPAVDQVLVVDDGSTDATSAVAQAAGADVLTLPVNGGKGRALRAGIEHCACEVLLLLDADLEDTAAQAGVLLPPVLRGEADMTIARFARSRPAGFGLARGLARWGIRHMTGLEVESPLSGQRAARRELLRQVNLADGWGIEVALTIDAVRQGYRVLEVPVEMRHRETGRDWQGFLHRGRQFVGILRALLHRCRLGGVRWS